MKQALINGNVFNGEEVLSNHSLIIDGNEILDVVPAKDFETEGLEIHDVTGRLLTPGFVDLQVNGGGGVMFNSDTSLDGLRRMSDTHAQYGTTGLLPTLITDSYDVMRRAIAAVDEAIEQHVPGILGIHLEGPFLNAQKKGAHDENKFCLLDEEGIEIITSLKRGKTIVTIAPELTDSEVIKTLVDAGLIVCAGHTAASYDDVACALGAGLHGFTHLFNAMTPLESRAPGVVGAALVDDRSWFGIIADGHHVHPAALKVAISAKQEGYAVLVTDAMATVGAKEKSFWLNGECIDAIDGRCMNKAGSLAGSDLDMLSAVNNAAAFADIDWLEAVRMASTYPAQALNLHQQLGYLKPGYKANILAFDENKRLEHIWLGGIARRV